MVKLTTREGKEQGTSKNLSRPTNFRATGEIGTHARGTSSFGNGGFNSSVAHQEILMKIKIITAANFRYKDLVIKSIIQCKKFGYDYEIYDLGGLGFGKSFPEKNKHFQEDGIYSVFKKEIGWFTKALFKPGVIKNALECNPNRILLWLDADAMIMKSLGEIGEDFDLALVVREEIELEYGNCRKGLVRELLGRYNAGVVFFNPTDNTKEFVGDWGKLTTEIGNDQYALHLLRDKIKVKELPFVYNDSKLTKDTIIYHARGRRSKDLGA